MFKQFFLWLTKISVIYDELWKYILFYRLVDNLPCATKTINTDTNEAQYEHGYRLGTSSNGKAYINNHLKLILLYHTVNE